MNKIFIFLIVSFVIGVPFLWYLYKKTPILVSPYIKADFARRVLAAWFDGVICLLILYPAYADKGFLIFSIITAAAYILLKDGLIEGRSIGKLVAGLRVIRLEDGKPANFGNSILRNFIFLLPGLNIASIIFELWSIYKNEAGIRLGDKFAKTHVVVGKDCIDWLKDLILYRLREKEMLKKLPGHYK